MKAPRVWVVLAILVSRGTALGDAFPVAAIAAQPSIAELQAAALRVARLEPERARAWERGMRLAALAPSLHLRVGHSNNALTATTDFNGATRLTLGDRDAWQFDVAAAWNLERLVWHPDEMRLARETQRLASRREKLLTEVAALAVELRRLQGALALTPPPSAVDAVDARLRIEELTAVLDALTGGALTRNAPPPPARTTPSPVDEEDAGAGAAAR